MTLCPVCGRRINDRSDRLYFYRDKESGTMFRPATCTLRCARTFRRRVESGRAQLGEVWMVDSTVETLRNVGALR